MEVEAYEIVEAGQHVLTNLLATEELPLSESETENVREDVFQESESNNFSQEELPVILIEQFRCGNCCVIDSEARKVSEFIFNDTQETGIELKLSVLETVLEVFNIKLEPFLVSCYEDLKVCYSCGVSLSAMYKCFQQFKQLSKADSIINELIKMNTVTHSNTIVEIGNKTRPRKYPKKILSFDNSTLHNTLIPPTPNNINKVTVNEILPFETRISLTNLAKEFLESRNTEVGVGASPGQQIDDMRSKGKVILTFDKHKHKQLLDVNSASNQINRISLTNLAKEFLESRNTEVGRGAIPGQQIDDLRSKGKVILTFDKHKQLLDVNSTSSQDLNAVPVYLDSAAQENKKRKTKYTEECIPLKMYSDQKSWPALCHLCGKSFYTPGALHNHMQRHITNTALSPKRSKFKCDLCNVQCRGLRELEEHKLIHQNERNFLCGVCEKSFNTDKDMVKHKKIHELRLENPKKCPTCFKLYTTTDILKYHLYSIHNYSLEELAGIGSSGIMG